MADINCFAFTGRLTKDASIRTLASGKKVLTADVAVNTGFGEYRKALYIKVQQWGDRGESIVPYLKKGQFIGGTGELSRNEWGDEGNKKVDFIVDVLSIQLLGSKPQNSSSSDSSSSDSSLHETENSNEVVF